MDMSVTVGAGTADGRSAAPPRRSPNSSDLDVWLEKVEALGELKRITAEVDPDLETATHHLSGRQREEPGAAVREHQGPSRPPRALQHDRLQPVALLPDDRREAGRRIRWRRCRSCSRRWGARWRRRKCRPTRAICNQNVVTGDAIDIRQFPGAAHVAARRREISRHRRCGDHRGSGDRPHQRRHLPDDDQGPARDRRLHLARQGRAPSTARNGGSWASRCRSPPPTASIRSCSSSPPPASRRPRASTSTTRGINGAPIELFVSDVTGLPLPARAEIILEGFVYPNETFAEGPFGEFTGYYGRPSGATPYHAGREDALSRQPDADLRPDGGRRRQRGRPVLGGAALGRRSGPTCRSSACPASAACGRSPRPPAGASPWCRSRRCMRGTRAQVMALAAQCTGGAYFGKYVIVVDDDVDPTNVHQVLWAMATRSRPALLDRHPARDLEHLSRSEPQPAGDPALGLQVR